MKLSVQCYTLREDFAKDTWGTFRALRDLGLEYVELAGYYGHTAAELKEGLDELGLRVNASHIGLDRLESDLDNLIAENHALGNKYVVLPWISEADYADGWTAFARRLTFIAHKLHDNGLKFAYHNHSFEFQPEGDRPGLDIFFENADPHVQAQIDVAWVLHGGQDPAAYIRRLGSRVPLVHLKDITDHPGWQDIEAGRGLVDWTTVLDACQEADVEFGTIELDNPPNGFQSVKDSLEFFRSKGL